MSIDKHPDIEEWKSEHPREAWALDQQKERFKRGFYASLLAGESLEKYLDVLVIYVESYAHWNKIQDAEEPPISGKRLSFDIKVLRYKLKKPEGGRRYYRVEFLTKTGWGGWFDTKNPGNINRIMQNLEVSVVGTIKKRIARFLVELEEDVTVL